MFDIDNLVRLNIRNLKPYSSARDEFKGHAIVLLDANENGFGSPLHENYNRYPDPLQPELKSAISNIKGIPAGNIFIGNGSDEAIDILLRIFCEPGTDNIIICPPTYGMYEVSANINNVTIKKVTLTSDLQLDIPGILQSTDSLSKMLFICSPNNPTGNSLHLKDIELLIQEFKGIVVIDEAYINYAKQRSCINFLTEYPNVVVLLTFSKAWGLAALRLGMAFASTKIIEYINKVKPPYNINLASQEIALSALENIEWVNQKIRETISERERLATALNRLDFVQKVFSSDANFILAKFDDPVKTYNYLVAKGIIVRNRSTVILCEGCLRITIGTPQQNDTLINTLQQIAL